MPYDYDFIVFLAFVLIDVATGVYGMMFVVCLMWQRVSAGCLREPFRLGVKVLKT